MMYNLVVCYIVGLHWFMSSDISVQSLSRVQLFETPWTAARQASLSITNSRSSLKLMSMSWWCHPAISSSVVPFSSCSQSLPASESFPMSQLFAWVGQSTGVSALASFSLGLIILYSWGKTFLSTLPNTLWILRFSSFLVDLGTISSPIWALGPATPNPSKFFLLLPVVSFVVIHTRLNAKGRPSVNL